MISTNEIKQQITQTKLNNLKKEINQLTKKEFEEIEQNCLQLIQETCLEPSGYNKENLLALFKSTAQMKPVDVDNILREVWKTTTLNLEDKAKILAKYIANNTSIPSKNFVKYMNKFFDIIKTDTELDAFLKNPQKYIDTVKNLSTYELHILQLVINEPLFNNLPDIKRTIGNTFVSTPVTTEMYHLNLPEYASTDATRFPQCINPNVKEEVLAKSRKQYHGPQVMGLGAQPSFDRGSIAQTAKSVRQMKMGACHNFAQLAADHFLSLMETGKIQQIPIKMVSHKAALGSHTFLLFDHKGDDLNNLSDCLIVDPWAVAMGHNYTYGVFTQENYPFPGMTTNLECCFDTQNPTVSNKTSPLNQELTHVLARQGLFANRSQEPVLSNTQRTAISFLTQLARYADTELHNAAKKEFMETLINQIKHGNASPNQSINTATVAMSAKIFEKIDDNNYSWRGPKTFTEAILKDFNEVKIQKYWSGYLHAKGLIAENEVVTTIDSTLLGKILASLEKLEEQTYSKPQNLNLNH